MNPLSEICDSCQCDPCQCGSEPLLKGREDIYSHEFESINDEILKDVEVSEQEATNTFCCPNCGQNIKIETAVMDVDDELEGSTDLMESDIDEREEYDSCNF